MKNLFVFSASFSFYLTSIILLLLFLIQLHMSIFLFLIVVIRKERERNVLLIIYSNLESISFVLSFFLLLIIIISVNETRSYLYPHVITIKTIYNMNQLNYYPKLNDFCNSINRLVIYFITILLLAHF